MNESFARMISDAERDDCRTRRDECGMMRLRCSVAVPSR